MSIRATTQIRKVLYWVVSLTLVFSIYGTGNPYAALAQEMATETQAPRKPMSPLQVPTNGPQASDVITVTTQDAPNTDISENLQDSTVMFIENVGQFDEEARFQVRGGSGILWLTEDALWVTVMDAISLPKHRKQDASMTMDVDDGVTPFGVNIRIAFEGANPAARLEPFNRLETSVNYFLGGGPEEGWTNVPVWGGVRYVDLYPGIDLEISGENGSVVQQLMAREGADPGVVRLHVDGASVMNLEGGKLRLVTDIGVFSLPLLLMNRIEGVNLPSPEVEGSDVLTPFVDTRTTMGGVREEIGAADLYYGTFLGGSGYDDASDLEVDGNGNTYITGSTWASDFPTIPGNVDPTYNGSSDAFVVKMNPTGSALVFATFLGGSGEDVCNGIALDTTGAVSIGGQTTSTDFFVTANAYDGVYNGGYWDGFVARLTDAGTGLWYSTYLGGSGDEWVMDIAVDSNNQQYVTGLTDSADYPANAYDTTYNDGGLDAFVTKLHRLGYWLDYSTFLGGSNGSDKGYSIAVDSSGNAYVTGETFSSDFPTTTGAFDTSYNGIWEAFAVKLSAGGNSLVYGTFLGGSKSDTGWGIAIDSSGAVYITGETYSSNFPTTGGAYDTSFNGGITDAFVLKLNPAGSALGYSTFLGGSSHEETGTAVANYAGTGICVVGYTRSSNFPTTAGAFDTSFSGPMDAFFARLNPAGSSLVYSTYLGGIAGGAAAGVAVFGSGYYVTGATTSSDFPTTAGAYDRTLAAPQDAFVVALGTQTYSHTVRVMDEYSNPINGAQVFRNGVLAGTTNTSGYLVIHDLAGGDTLAARKFLYEAPSPKGTHNHGSVINWAYHVYITSVAILPGQDANTWVVTDPFSLQTLTIKKDNTLIGFNIVTSVNWNARESYLNDLQKGFQLASNYIFDASDGQMLFERVTIYDNNQHEADADYLIRASNQEWPHSEGAGVILTEKNNHIKLGRFFNGESSNSGSWTDISGFSTLIHEVGHYGLGLLDSYQYYDKVLGYIADAHCTSPDIRTNNTPDLNATLMDFAYNSTEFSMKNVNGLWSADCEDTDQWAENGESDWETIVRLYSDTNKPARWILKTPKEHGGIVIGPWNTIPGWSSVVIGNNASAITCLQDDTYKFLVNGKALLTYWVYLEKPDRDIFQGRTDDKEGWITFLGASPNDDVLVQYSSNGYMYKINCKSTNSAGSTGTLAGEPIIIDLQPAAFQLDISSSPGTVDGDIDITVKASTLLSGLPVINLTQDGAPASMPVTLSYNASLGAYTGILALDSNLPHSGIIHAEAVDLASNKVDAIAPFAFLPVDPVKDDHVRSFDGQAVLYLPAGSLSAAGRVAITPGWDSGATPEGLFLLGGPYSIQGGPGVSLVGGANISLFYLDMGGTLERADLNTLALYRWDGSAWQELHGTASRNEDSVSAPISAFGTYAVMAEFRPTIEGNAGMPGTTITYVTSTTQTVNADGSGNYSFTVPYNWSGTVTPSLAGYTFSPASRAYSALKTDQAGQDFTALVTISGNAGERGVMLAYLIGVDPKTVLSDQNGNYTITVPFGWSGTVTPTKVCGGQNSLTVCTFTPSQKLYSNVQVNQVNQDYVLKRVY